MNSSFISAGGEITTTTPKRFYDFVASNIRDPRMRSIVFLHSVEAGPANRSYGVQAARLAGVPKPVLARAKQVLAQLENGAGPHGPLTLPTDMPLFCAPVKLAAEEGTPHPVLEKLAALDTDSLSPREALDILYALKAAL